MPPLNGDNLRKFLPSEYAIVYLLKLETYKAIGLLFITAIITCIPYWILSSVYLRDPGWYIDNYLPYAWIYVRCFWNGCFLVAFYHPIVHIRATNLFCISLVIFLLFSWLDTYFAYYYLQKGADDYIDESIASFARYTHTYNQHICDIFNCAYIDSYHFMLFVLSFPLMLIFGLLASILYLQCFTIYGVSSSTLLCSLC